MIAKLYGIVDSFDTETVILNVGGVGYLVFASSRTLSRLPPVGQSTVMLTETVVKEDSVTLYGFFDENEKRYFKLLTTVQGVGAKVALALLSAFSPDELGAAIASGDSKAITKANGVGAKIAARIANELKDKIGTSALLSVNSVATGGAAVKSSSLSSSATPAAEAISALCNLGYQKMDVTALVLRIAAENESDDTAALIKKALKELAK